MPPTADQVPKNERLSPVVWRLGWVSFFTDVATEMIYPLLPAFLATMGAAGRWLGIVEGVAESVGALVKWRTGVVSDKAPVRKPYVVAGYTLSSLARPLTALAVAPWQVVIVRATDRVGKGLRSAPRDALLAIVASPERRAAAFAVHQMMDNLGAVVGPLVAFTLARALGWSIPHIFAWTIVPGILAVATLVFGVKEPAASQTPTPPPAGVAAPPSERLPGRVRGYLVAVAVFSLGASADSFLMLRLSRLGLAVAYLPIAWLSLNAVKATLNVPGGRIADRIGHKPTLLGGWVLYAAVYAMLPFAQSVEATWILMLLYGGYYGLSEGAEKALLAEMVTRKQRGRAFGAFHAITGIAVLPANAVFGFLFDLHPRMAFWFGAGAAALGALLLAPLRPKEKDASISGTGA